jgi:hypothetical protein
MPPPAAPPMSEVSAARRTCRRVAYLVSSYSSYSSYTGKLFVFQLEAIGVIDSKAA